MRKDTFFGAALLLVSPRPAESGVVAPQIERLPQRLGLHDLGVHLRTRDDRRYAAFDAILIDVDDQIEAKSTRSLVAERDHLLELPRRVNVQKRERRLPGIERLHRQMEHDARSLCRSNKA